jgi:peptidoglycan hydrolase-like protein with peptidoglycan-binding domain
LDQLNTNWRGALVIAAMVITGIILLAIDPGNEALPIGVSSISENTSPTTPATTSPTGSTTATSSPTATTRKGSTATTKPAATTTIPPSQRPVLKQGSTGADVMTLQQKLIALSLLTGTADGNFGPATTAAVIKFQQSKNLPADGVVGPSTWAALG